MLLRIVLYVVVYTLLFSGLIPARISDLLEAACFSGLLLHLIHAGHSHAKRLTARKEKKRMCNLFATAVVNGDTVELTRGCREHDPNGSTSFIPVNRIDEMVSDGAFQVAMGNLNERAYYVVIDAFRAAGLEITDYLN
jgi:hypothetical protein